MADALDDLGRDGDRAGRDLADGLDPAERALGDLSQEADKAGRDLADGLERGERASDDLADAIKADSRTIEKETGDAADKAEKKFKDAFDTVKKESKDAGDRVGKDVKDGFDKAGEAGEEFKDESAQIARESATSFSGEFEDVTDVIRDLAANAFQGFGPAGAAAGVAAAVGLGLVVEHLNQVSERINEVTEEAGAFALELRDSEAGDRAQALADRFDEVATSLADVRSVWEVWQPRAITAAEKFGEAVESGAISAQDLQDAFTDENPQRRLEALRSIIEDTGEATDDYYDAVINAMGATSDLTQAELDAAEAMGERAEVSGAVRKIIEEQIAFEEAQIAILEGLAKANGETVEAYQERIDTEREAQQVQEDYQAALEAMGDASSIYDSALATNEESVRDWAAKNGVSVDEAMRKWEGAELTLDEVLTELSNRVAAERAFAQNLDQLAARGYGALADELRAGGPEANAAITEMLAEATDDKVGQFADDQGYLLGKDLGKGTRSAIQDEKREVRDKVRDMMTGLPTGRTSVSVDVDLEPAKRQLRSWHPTVVATARLGQRIV